MTAIDRRRFIAGGVGGLVIIVGGGYELIEQGVLPGKGRLDQLLGACSVSGPKLTFAKPGPVYDGSFYSKARGMTVRYRISYPTGHDRGSDLPLVLSLHAFGGDYASGLGDVTVAKALAASHDGVALKPMAVVSVDGGGLYWNPHPGDNPQAMLVDEVVPMCQKLGLGRGKGRIATIGISMGGYGALLLSEKHPELISAVAAISPAVWTTYAQARSANSGAFASAADFASDDVITHASALAQMPVRIASGSDDPFHPGVVALAAKLPASAIVEYPTGCHDDSFFGSQQHQALSFLGSHLV